MNDRDTALELLTRAVAESTADQTEIVLESVHTGITRFARSHIHQTTELNDQRIAVRAVADGAIGRSSGTLEAGPDLEATLTRLVREATASARIQQPNPAFVSLPGPEPVKHVEGYDTATSRLTPGDRSAAIRTVVDLCGEQEMTVSGTYLSEARSWAVVNSLGIATWTPTTTAFLRALPDSGRGTGYADALSHRAADIDATQVAERALASCAANHDQISVPPGEYEAIFEDLAVAEMLLYLGRHALNAQALQDGRSFLAGRLGERVTGESVSIWNDPTDPRGLPAAADYEGVPARHVALIDHGIAVGVVYDSFTANKAGHGQSSTGNAPNPERSFFGPTPANLFMAGAHATPEEMVASTKRGLLVTRFHYTHCPDPKTVTMTGTTRDGTFLIEDGVIIAAVRNLRLTQSVPALFEGIQLRGHPRLCRDWWSSNGMGRVSAHCPPIKVARAVFTSGTRF